MQHKGGQRNWGSCPSPDRVSVSHGRGWSEPWDNPGPSGVCPSTGPKSPPWASYTPWGTLGVMCRGPVKVLWPWEERGAGLQAICGVAWVGPDSCESPPCHENQTFCRGQHGGAQGGAGLGRRAGAGHRAGAAAVSGRLPGGAGLLGAEASCAEVSSWAWRRLRDDEHTIRWGQRGNPEGQPPHGLRAASLDLPEPTRHKAWPLNTGLPRVST